MPDGVVDAMVDLGAWQHTRSTPRCATLGAPDAYCESRR